MNRHLIFGMATAALAITACSKSNNTVTTPVNENAFQIITSGSIVTVKNLDADTIIGISTIGQPFGSGKFAFFSIENKTRVANTDSASAKWDIAFRGTTILTNAGISGSANGGAFVWNGVFDDLKVIPADSTFKTDAATGYAIPTGSNKGWYNYNGINQLITPLPGKVLVIKTASGKYAKVEILNYYRGGITPSSTASDSLKIAEQRYFTLRYVYQSNGTKTF